MDELIKITNIEHAKYEDLLMERDKVRKEARILRSNYMRKFGELILELYRKKIDSIEKKKIIEYYQKALNKGEKIDAIEMDKAIREAMASYQENLDKIVEEYNQSKHTEKISQFELLQIKRIYRKLAKQLHPDINPITEHNGQLMDLWSAIVCAYNSNDLEELQALEVIATKVLEQQGMGPMAIEIPDINERIEKLEAEIREIKTTEPYTYRHLLDDADAVIQKEEELKAEIKQYDVYIAQLEEIIEQLMMGGTITWRMS